MTKIEEILDGRSEIAKIQKIQFEVFIYNDVIEAMKIRDEIKVERAVKGQLDTAISMVESKADSPNGIKKEEIKPFELPLEMQKWINSKI
mgnify:CR=1 FL=1